MALLGKPRLFQLVEITTRAQALKWRREVQDYVRRAAFGTGGLIFGIFMLLGLHIAVWVGLMRPFGPVGAALGIAGLDLVLCLVLGWMATRQSVDSVAQGAGAVRADALQSVSSDVRTLGGLLRRRDGVSRPRSRRVRVYPARR